MKKLKEIWKEIKKYDDPNCPLKTKPLLFRIPKRANVMVITEGPNVEEKAENIASLANHPTFTFLQPMFKGKFRPLGRGATAYWTHLRKCPLREAPRALGRTTDEDKRKGHKALRICAGKFLLQELKALKPKLVVAVGEEAKNFFQR